MTEDAPNSRSTRVAPPGRYQAALRKFGFSPDPGQDRAVEAFHRIYEELMSQPHKRGLSRLFNPGETGVWPAVSGLYLWGPVGRGKTWLMDLFFAALPLTAKRRTHFHRFMQDIHGRRRRQRHAQDPLVKIAAELAAEVRVLCFDEFFVEDVGDAMILGRLLDALLGRGVTLVATSNTPPDDLYAGGLQRERFLPAIELIKRHSRVMRLDNGEDYRLRALSRAGIYHYPLDHEAEEIVKQTFRRLAGSQEERHDVKVMGRPIPCRGYSANAVWFDFDALCRGPRGAADYIELTRCHHTLLISNVPQMQSKDDNAARRFISLVDEAYDRGVKLVITAEAPAEALYQGKHLRAPFERTQSRLIEMQSRAYLGRGHRRG